MRCFKICLLLVIDGSIKSSISFTKSIENGALLSTSAASLLRETLMTGCRAVFMDIPGCPQNHVLQQWAHLGMIVCSTSPVEDGLLGFSSRPPCSTQSSVMGAALHADNPQSLQDSLGSICSHNSGPLTLTADRYCPLRTDPHTHTHTHTHLLTHKHT